MLHAFRRTVLPAAAILSALWSCGSPSKSPDLATKAASGAQAAVTEPSSGPTSKSGDPTSSMGGPAAGPQNAPAGAKSHGGPPASLRNDAYRFYGLADDASHDVQLSTDDGAGGKRTLTGSVKIEFDRVDGNRAIYQLTRTGGLADTLGNEELRLGSEGIAQIGTSLGTVVHTSLEMAAHLKSGTRWSSGGAIKGFDGNTQAQLIRYTVVGETHVQTKAGSFRALEIKSSGSVTGTQAGSVDATDWYVADHGLVKSVIHIHVKKRIATVTLERTS